MSDTNSIGRYYEATAGDANRLTLILKAKGLDIDAQAQRVINTILVSAYQDGMIAAYKKATKETGE